MPKTVILSAEGHKTKRKLSIRESNPGLPRLTRLLLTSGNHDH
jgi:hypothetical protein